MKTIRKNLLLLAFAAGALFVIGNNVLAGSGPGEGEREIKVLPEVTITCSREGVPGAQCWIKENGICVWTGSMLTTC